MFLSAIVLVTPPTDLDRPGVLRPGWSCPAITLYGDRTVLQVLFWPFFRAGEELNGGLTLGSKDLILLIMLVLEEVIQWRKFGCIFHVVGG